MAKKLTLREARLKAGLTQFQAAELLGVHYQAIRLWEKGKGISRANINKVVNVYGISEKNLIFIERERGRKLDERN